MSITANNYSNTAIYEYDKIGNITKAGDITYEYDSLGQLVHVNDPRYGTTVYVYDVGGNIKYVKSYDYTIGELGAVKDTKPYTYCNTSWKDLLTSYNGQSITYDEIGNPVNYMGSTLTWQMGRQLASLTKNSTTYNYKYNVDGLRTYKTDGETAYSYTWEDGSLVSQTGGGNTLNFIYEGTTPKAIEYNGTTYYYVTNLQGDVIAILDKNGNPVVEYTYDAWGKVLSVTGSLKDSLGQDNPLRYRGYCYDTETGFYYLQSRYYDPTVGRFINADEIGYLGANETLLSYNLFAYCENNPVMHKDNSGTLLHALLGAIAGALFAGISYYVEYLLGMRNHNWWSFAAIVATGAILGAIGGYINGWVKFVKIVKHARLPRLLKKLKSPVIRELVRWSVRGIKFVINGFVKNLSRRPGENWVKAIRRWLRI